MGEAGVEKERFVVVGGNAAGMSAASKARSLRPDMEILVFEGSGYVSHIACGMPYLISDRVKSSDALLVYDPRFFKEKRNIGVFLHSKVTQIIPQRKAVLVRNLKTGEAVEHSYDKLLVSTGARPVVPPIDGRDLDGVFTMRQHGDGITIKAYIDRNSPKEGVVLGGGYIGMEMAEAFSERGMKVTVVEKMPNILGTMDDEITEIVEEELRGNGVRLVKSKGVVRFAGQGSAVRKAILDDGESIDAGIALVGAGIRANSEMAAEAGVKLGRSGAIDVSQRMETNVPNIYAAGDCSEAYHLVLARNVYIPLGTTANKQGRIAGENAAGGTATFAGIVGTAVFKVFGLEVGRTGLTEKEARNEGIECVSNVIEHTSRSHFYPGTSSIRIKLVAAREAGQLLGAQMVGKEGVSKRIDVFAAALTAKMTAGEVANLDLAYAPPFAPVYDPVLIAAEQLKKRVTVR